MSENEKIDRLVSDLLADPEWLGMVRGTYDAKARRCVMPPLQDWLREKWAKNNVREAGRAGGGYSPEKALDIARVEYFGDEIVRAVMKIAPEADWLSYVCDGRVEYSFRFPDSYDGVDSITGKLSDLGCDEVDADGMSLSGEILVFGSRKYEYKAGRGRKG